MMMMMYTKIWHYLVQSDYFHALDRQSDHAVEHWCTAFGIRDCLGRCMVTAHDEGAHFLTLVTRHSYASNVVHVILVGVLEPDPSGQW